MPDRRDIILGGGLAGLSAAYHLQLGGEDHWQVLERNERVGGVARTIARDGYLFDYGPHILFTIDREMEELIRDLLGDNFHAQERQAFIYHAACDLYTRFPFQAHLYGLPVALVEECLVGLVRAIEARARGEFKPANYEQWMRGFFGDGIAERLMIPYAKKIWTVEPATMDFSWIGRRVPTPDVERIVRGALGAEVEQVGATAGFWYTRQGGIEPLPRALGARCNNVDTRRTVERIELAGRRLVMADGEVIPYASLVYTLPLCYLDRFVSGLTAEVERAVHGLRYQGIQCVNIGVDREDVSDKHWIYYYEDPFPFHRLSLPKNFSPDTVPAGKSSIATEVAFRPEEEFEEGRAIERTVEALRKARLLEPNDRIDLAFAEAILPAYIIYDLDHAHNVETIRGFLREHGIHLAGRFGEWQYFNMDHSMRSGRRAADAILAGR